MENKNPDSDEQGVDGKDDDSRCSSKSRPKSSRKDESTFTAVEIDRQRAG